MADAVEITGYHAHIYFDEATRASAERVTARLAVTLSVNLEDWYDAPVGPHLVSNVLVPFAVDEFARVMPWLMLNREGLSILVHPITSDDVADHDQNGAWLGRQLVLDLNLLTQVRD
jgi:aromatic ring-cleaving dioxygenase